MKRFQVMCLAAMAALASAGRPAVAAVFDEVPSDALAVLEVKNLDQFNAKWNKFADTTGLTQLSPDAKDPLSYLESQAGVTQGVNSAGDFGVVLMIEPQDHPRMVLLVPVSDYKAFVGNFTNTQEDADGVTAGDAKDGAHLLMAHWGDYAAVTRSKALLAKKPQGIKLDGITADAVSSKDAVLWFNMDQVRSQELPKLKESRDAIIDRFSKGQAGGLPAMARFGWSFVFDQAEEFITDAKTSVITANITDDGIALSSVSDFLPDTPYSKLAGSIKGTDQPLLTGLPDKRYLLLFGEVLSPELKQQYTALVLDPMLKKLDNGDAANKPILDLMKSSQAKLAAVDSAAVGILTPDGNPGQDPMFQLVGAMTGDSAAYQKAALAGLRAVDDMFKNAGSDAKATITIDTKPDATTVEGVHLDQFSIKTDLTGNGRQAARFQQMQALIYGPSGEMGYLGAVTDKAGVITMDIDDQSALLADAIAGAKSGKDVLSAAKSIQDVSAKLPATRVAEGFIYVDQLLGVGVRIAQSFNLGVHFDLPADVDPIGVAISGNGSTLQGDVFIPGPLVKAVAGAVNSLRGPGGGGNGGHAPAPGL